MKLTHNRRKNIGALLLIQVGCFALAADFWATRRVPGSGMALLMVGGFVLLVTLALIRFFALVAKERGYSPLWGFMALLSVAGCIVILCLPDRAGVQRGFPVQPVRSPPDGPTT